jgi:hypothetical protein
MKRLNIAPKIYEILKETPSVNTWLQTVGDRLNIYSGASDPTLAEVPENQWIIFTNTSTSETKIWLNIQGTSLISLNLDGSVLGGVSSFSFTNANGVSGTVTNPSTTPDLSLSLGDITPTSVAATGVITSSGGRIGYATGAGGTVTQLVNKTTGVTLNALTGRITLASGSIGAGSIASFTLTNSFITATDLLVLNHVSGGTNAGKYTLNAQCGSGTALITIGNYTTSSLNDQPVIGFAIIKAVTS